MRTVSESCQFSAKSSRTLIEQVCDRRPQQRFAPPQPPLEGEPHPVGDQGTARLGGDGDGVMGDDRSVLTAQFDRLARREASDHVDQVTGAAREAGGVRVAGSHTTVTGDAYGPDRPGIPLLGRGEIGQLAEHGVRS